MRKPDFSAHCIKVTLICVNVIFWLSGCAIMAVGLWLLVDPSVVRMASVVHVSLVVNDSFILVVAALFVSLGIFALLVGLCGCCGAVRESKLLLSLYMLSLFLVAAGELTGGVYAVVRRDEIKDSLIRNGVRWLREDYLNDTTSRHFNSWMQEFRCCGLVNYTDFENSAFSKTKASVSWNCSLPASDNADKTIPLPSPCCFAETTSSVTTTTDITAAFVSHHVTTTEPRNYTTTEMSHTSAAVTSIEYRTTPKDKLMPSGCVESLVGSARSNLLIVVLVAYLVVIVKVFGFAMALCLCRRIDAD